MKKIFVVGFLLWGQSICISSGKLQAAETIHNRHLEWDKGIVIYYPEEYKSYEDFKKNYLEKDYVEELLDERLKLLKKINDLRGKMDSSRYDVKVEAQYEHYKSDLILNEIALRSNATAEMLDSIPFSQDSFDNTEMLYEDQMKSIDNILKHLPSIS